MGPRVPKYENNEWRLQAACRGGDPDLFFPDGYSDTHKLVVEAAKEFCGRCVVRAACLNYALEKPEDFGIWGGMTPAERRPLRRKSRAG